MKKAKVLPINHRECYAWVLNKHYAKRKPRMQFCFGFYVDNLLEGIITFGYPATPFVSRGLCGREYENFVLELNRLVINSGTPKNSASYLIAQSIKLLPDKYKIIVSYADTSLNHIGYVYQATNFIYTGLTIPMKEWGVVGSNLHSQNVCKKKSLEERRKDKKYKQINRPQKHRYILFRGNKKEKEILKNKLNYDIFSYPKGKSSHYISPDITEKQMVLLQ